MDFCSFLLKLAALGPERGYTWRMDDSDEIFDALYQALDTLEELDPDDSDEPWFQVLEKALDRAVKSHLGLRHSAQD